MMAIGQQVATATASDTLGDDDALCESVEWSGECVADASAGNAAAATAITGDGDDDEQDDDDEFVYSDAELDDGGDDDDVDWEDVAGGASAPRSVSSDCAAPAAAASGENAPSDGDAHERDDGDDGDDGDDDGDETFEPEDDNASIDDDDDDSSSDRDNSAAQRVVMNLQKVNWAQVNAVLQQEAAKAAKIASRKRRTVQRMTKADKARELALHETHVLLLLATQLKWNALCQSPVLRGLLLSLTSGSSAFDLFVEPSRQPLAYALELLVRWFRQHFRVAAADANDGDASDDCAAAGSELLTEARLLQVFFDRVGRDYELAVLFTALCRALRLYCRHTCALDARLVQHTRAFEASTAVSPSGTNGSSGRWRKRLRAQSGQSPTPSDETETSASGGAVVAAPSFWVWTEVFDEQRRAWVHVDAVRRLVARPQDVEVLRGRGAPFSYVVGVTASERVADVTPRYASKWSKSLALRIAHEWMGHTLEALNEDAMRRRSHRAAAAVGHAPFRFSSADESELLAQEQAQLLALTAREVMPTSLEGFKKHHVFCLERHLKRFECVHPRKAVGIFKGQPVFLRSHVHVTRSLYDWRRLGREVRACERQQPAKWYVRGKQLRGTFSGSGGDRTAAHPGGGTSDISDDNSDDDDAPDAAAPGDTDGPARALFGEWQTDAFVAPAVVDGVVPKNEYGNVEVWSEAHVPRHGAHVRLPRIATVAQELGVDFAPALVGFEVQNDRTVPVFDGIVVAETVLELLLDAHAHVQQRTIERAIAKNQSIVVKRWERLVTRLLLGQRLEDDYGAVGDRKVKAAAAAHTDGP